MSDVEHNQYDRISQSTMEESQGKEIEETEASIEMEEIEESEETEENEEEEENEEKQELSPEDKFRVSTVEGKWDEVIRMYNTDSNFRKVVINKSRGTALHVAVNDGKEDVVKSLVEIIIKHENELKRRLKKRNRYVKALELKNERGDTPLHLAATRGFKVICEYIIGENGKRNKLINIDNKEGETPLFHAALSWQKQTFMYLCSLMPAARVKYTRDLIRKNGDSILHCAIRREFFDLALIIMHKYPKLHDVQNREGFSPLKLLATRPSAFWSGSKLIWWKRMLYHCVPVETLDVERAMTSYMEKANKPEHNVELPENYQTCYHFFRGLGDLAVIIFQELVAQLHYPAVQLRHFAATLVSGNVGVKQGVPGKDQQCQISMPEDSGEIVPRNYATCFRFVKLAYMYILGLSGAGIDDIRKMKQKHKWSGQLLSELMKEPYESYKGSGGPPPPDVSHVTKTDFAKISAAVKQGHNDKKITTGTKQAEPQENKKHDIEETAILVAARNGIVEMVNELLSKIPSAIHETNSERKNILLVAVENRQPLVVEALRNRFRKDEKTQVVLNNLILGVDDQENTVLHLAANTPSGKAWQISGAALQMMWDIKWFQYIKELVPEHFTIRSNQKEKTAGEIFKESHKDLARDGSEWLKDTSESCSVVAALLTGVSFATSSTVPGGNKSDTGKPALDGRPAFEAFAIASLIGLCFSVTALIMFLSILTSRKEAKDFRKDLPMKLLLGLSSLFVSIAAMLVAFCSGHFFVLEDKYKKILFLIYAVTCLPVSFYAIAQFPLYTDLVIAIAKKVPQPGDKGDDL